MTGPSGFLKTIHHSPRLLALVGVAPRSPERLKCRQQQLEGPLPASRFLASYVCRVSNDAYRMNWKAKVGSIIDRPWHEEFKQPAWREIEEVDQVGMEIGRAMRRSMARKKEANPLLEASIGRGRPSCWELLAAVPPGDKPLPATELP
ncbi:hypothetical protein G5I_04904 [Acromyrmex echinatior]|uniref:Uncharacterized protein n=1 Tax=Acromyrmex echinatior TaxID=103372 RepID=F4WGV3_ACREC|nr:hypothetical protein G5I_04904 [Acromyrmex echinatior]